MHLFCRQQGDSARGSVQSHWDCEGCNRGNATGIQVQSDLSVAAPTLLRLRSLLCFYIAANYSRFPQALAEEQDPFSDVLDDHEEGDEPRDNRDTYWSERDRLVIGPCQGLMKASLACLKKLSAAVRSNGDVGTPQNVAQLDDLADISKEISPG